MSSAKEEYKACHSDKVVRHVYSKRNISANAVKPNAFIPPNDYPNELSVDKANNPDIEEEQIIELGNNARPDKTLYGRGELMVEDICKLDDGQDEYLKVLIDGDPHPRHGNIKDIPVNDALRKAVATELSNIAKPIKYDVLK